MKKYNLRIAHFNLEQIVKHIKDVKELFGMELTCKNADINKVDDYNRADVLILDMQLGQAKIDEIVSTSASYAKYILFTDEASFRKLDRGFINIFFDVWLSTDTMLDYKANKLIKDIYYVFNTEFTESILDVLTNSLPDLIWVKGLDGAHLFANNPFCLGAGKTREQVLGRDDAYIWNIDVTELAEEGNDCLNTDDLVIKEQGTHLFDEQVKFDNEMRQFKTYKSAVLGRNGESIATVGLARDVTEIWNTHEDFKKLISSLPIATLIVDSEYNFVSVNESFEEIFTYPKEYNATFSLKNFGNYFFREDIVLEESKNITTNCSLATVEENMPKKYFAVQKSAIHNVFNTVSGYFYIFRDITEDHETQEHLAKLAEIDELTQINNRKGLRRYFNEVMPTIMCESQSLAIFMIDIDFFKKYNDHYGHLEGDVIIKKIASILESVKAENGLEKDKIFVARFGGEEFIIVINDSNLDTVKEIAVKIESKLANAAIPHKMSDVAPHVTLSMGIAYYNTVTAKDDISDIMKNADDALYKSKQTGRNKHTLMKYN